VAVILTEDVLQDDLALSAARVIATANKQALASDVDALDSVLTMQPRVTEDEAIWRVDYGGRNITGRRGGGLTVDVTADGGTVKQVLRGQ